MNAVAHELLTKRLRLRWMTVDDAGLLLSIWNDPAFVMHVGDRGVRTVEEAAHAFREGPEQLYKEYGYGPYRVAFRDSDEAVGICGLFRREGLADADIGFALLPQYCGKGLAGEAAIAVRDHARYGLHFKRLTAIVSPGNAPSIGLVEKLGLQFERMITMPGEDKEVSLYGVDW